MQSETSAPQEGCHRSPSGAEIAGDAISRKFEQARALGKLERAIASNLCMGNRGPIRVMIREGTTGDLLTDPSYFSRRAYWFLPDGSKKAVRVHRDRFMLLDSVAE